MGFVLQYLHLVILLVFGMMNHGPSVFGVFSGRNYFEWSSKRRVTYLYEYRLQFLSSKHLYYLPAYNMHRVSIYVFQYVWNSDFFSISWWFCSHKIPVLSFEFSIWDFAKSKYSSLQTNTRTHSRTLMMPPKHFSIGIVKYETYERCHLCTAS